MSDHTFEDTLREVAEVSEMNAYKAKFHGEATMREEFGVLMGKNVAQSSSLFSAQILAEQVDGKVVRCTVTTSRWVEVEA